MKKITATLFAIVLTFSLVMLVSCGDKNKNEKDRVDFPFITISPED